MECDFDFSSFFPNSNPSSKCKISCDSESSFGSELDNDFTQIFPPELSNKLFVYLSDKDLYSCVKCCIHWRDIINNNPQWKLRCNRRGWNSQCGGNGDENYIVHKWNEIKSHISPDENFRFRLSPAFILKNYQSKPNSRLSPLCEWAIYFRKRLHLQRNWTKGIYNINKLYLPEDKIFLPTVINDTHTNGSLLVAGTYTGYVLVWSLEGVPKYLGSIPPYRRRAEVEAVRLVSEHLIVLYQVFKVKQNDLTGDYKFNGFYQTRGIGSQSENIYDFNLQVENVSTEEEYQIIEQYIPENERNDVEWWIRSLFLSNPLIGDVEDEFFGSKMEIILLTNVDHIFLTGLKCKCFVLWDIHEFNPPKKVLLKSGSYICHQGYVSSKKLYFSTRKDENEEIPFFWLTVYDIESLGKLETISQPFFELSSNSEIEEIRSDAFDKRVVYATEVGELIGISLENKDVLFSRRVNSYVDNLTVSDSVIAYHQYDGILIGINWIGEVLYEIEAHIGLVKGLQSFGNLLISGGDAKELFVWDLHKGNKLHKVHHQPSTIQYLYADSTKIVTTGKGDQPILIGYW